MSKRLFEGNDAWSSVAGRCANEVTILLKDVLAKLESELGDTVDLRDFHFVINHAAGGFVADLSLTRRFGDGNEQPREIIESYPRLSPVCDKDITREDELLMEYEVGLDG